MHYRVLRYPGGKAKAVSFSYDDGCRQDIRLSELLEKHGIKCTFNINSGIMLNADGTTDRLTADEIRKSILACGHEIAVHGEFHRANGIITAAEGIKEVLNCRLQLENEFGEIVRGMAYPDTGVGHFHNGTDYATVKRYLTDLGIDYARALGEKNEGFKLPQDWHRWMPTAHHNDDNVFELIDRFLQLDLKSIYYPYTTPKLFYLWGHSYELDVHNNWDRMEEICSAIGGKEDIWYATNGQIYDYTAAYNSLVLSADGTRMYNPSCTTVWLEADRRLYTVEPGRTIKID